MSADIVSIRWDGQRISRPGIYANVPLADYHRGDICDGPSISSSGLSLLWRKSPKHFWDRSPLNPQADIDTDNADFVLGRAVHHLILREPDFASLFVVRPTKVRDDKTKKLVPWHGNRIECRAWLDEQKKLGKSVLKPDDVDALKGMAAAIRAHPFAGDALNGLIERSLFWKDMETGIWLKARPDAIPTASGDFADLKTTQSTLYIDLQMSLGNFGYIQQAALVFEGAQVLGIPVSSFSHVWVEKTRPYCVDVKPLVDEDIARGFKMNRVALRLFHECFVNKSWPDPGERSDAQALHLSDKAREIIDKRLSFELKEAA